MGKKDSLIPPNNVLKVHKKALLELIPCNKLINNKKLMIADQLSSLEQDRNPRSANNYLWIF